MVEFGSLEDLERIVSTMSPDWGGSLTALTVHQPQMLPVSRETGAGRR